MKAARREDGVALVEFALVLPLLLFVCLGFLQFGLAMNAKIDATHLTAEGARYTAVNQNPGGATQSLQQYIKSRADTARLRTATVCVSYPTNAATGTSGKVGDPVTVTIGPIDYVPLVGALPVIPSVLPTAAVSSDATMRLEALPTNVPAGCA